MQQPHLSCLHGTFNPPGAAENIETSEDPDTFFLLSFIPFKKSLQNSNAPPSVHWLFTPDGPRYSRNQPTKRNFFSSTSGELKVPLSSTSRQGGCRTTSVRLCCHWWAKFFSQIKACRQLSVKRQGGRREVDATLAGCTRAKVEVIVTLLDL